MKNLAKYFIAGSLIFNSYLGLKAQQDSITLQPKYSQEFWEDKEGFKFVKGDTTYSIENSEEILKIKKDGWEAKIIEKNHYGNVESLCVEDPKKRLNFQIDKKDGGLKYHFEKRNKKRTKTKHIKLSEREEKNLEKNYFKFDRELREFKKENNIEEKLKNYSRNHPKTEL